MLSAATAKALCRKLEPGNCAWLTRVIIRGIRNSHILRKPFNSSEFLSKSQNKPFLLHESFVWLVIKAKKQQFWAERYHI
jgi:hypothetical protein